MRAATACLWLLLLSCATGPIEPTRAAPWYLCECHGPLRERVLIVGKPDPDTYRVAYYQRPKWHGEWLERDVGRFYIRPCGMWMP